MGVAVNRDLREKRFLSPTPVMLDLREVAIELDYQMRWWLQDGVQWGRHR